MSRPPHSDRVCARPLHIELRLDWLIGLARLERAAPARRLNALENLVVELCRRWRDDRARLDPTRDFRLSAQTSHALAEWVQLRGPAVGRDVERLLSVTTGTVVDNEVPDGWIRVLLVPRA